MSAVKPLEIDTEELDVAIELAIYIVETFNLEDVLYNDTEQYCMKEYISNHLI